jgi:hypothetical protein
MKKKRKNGYCDEEEVIKNFLTIILEYRESRMVEVLNRLLTSS